MKTNTLRTILLTTLSLLLVMPGFSQKGIEDGSKYGKGRDSINCIKNLSLYREFFKHSNYRDAIGPWRGVFSECPASSEKMYVQGVTMYKSFIEAAQIPDRKDEMIDTMLLIYDRRMEYYPGALGSILGRKAIDLLRLRRSDIESVADAYGYLKNSIEIDESRSREAVIVTFISVTVNLNKAGRFDDNQAIEDYFMVTAIVDELLEKSSRWSRVKKSIDDVMLKSGLLTCEALNGYFEPQFAANQADRAFLEKVITFYTATGCDRSDLYVSASEKMYEIVPGPESAHNLARLFISKNDYHKAAQYLKEAVVGINIDNSTKAEWFYELAVVSSANGDFCGAITYAKEAVANKSDYGKAYITMGDAIIATREMLGDDFERRTAFWVAADKFTKAKSVDPSVSGDASKKLSDYAGQYPNHEEVFFRDLKDGDSYQVKGCINEYTTVRSRK